MENIIELCRIQTETRIMGTKTRKDCLNMLPFYDLFQNSKNIFMRRVFFLLKQLKLTLMIISGLLDLVE